MTEKWKSTIRHFLTAIGVLIGFFGLGEWLGFIDLISANLDAVFGAVEVIIGFVLAIIGFFKNKERFAVREELAAFKAKK
jgi:hypothetical protein